MAWGNEMLGSILDSGLGLLHGWLVPCLMRKAFFRRVDFGQSTSPRIQCMSKHRTAAARWTFFFSPSLLFPKIFLPVPWISDSRRLSRRIHNAEKKGLEGTLPVLMIRKVTTFYSKVSSLYDLSPPSNGLVYMSIFLPSWHFSHFPKIEFRWPFSFSPFLPMYAHTHKSTQYITPRESMEAVAKSQLLWWSP